MDKFHTDLRSIAAEIEQDFMQKGGFESCLFLLKKLSKGCQEDMRERAAQVCRTQYFGSKSAKAVEELEIV